MTHWPGISERVLGRLGGFLAKAFVACGAVSQTGSLTVLVGISDHVEAPAEGFNVARDDLERGRLPVLDLGTWAMLTHVASAVSLCAKLSCLSASAS